MKKMVLIFVLLSVVLAFAACQKGTAKLAYPVTKKVDQVDDYFGTKVADPYRWLGTIMPPTSRPGSRPKTP